MNVLARDLRTCFGKLEDELEFTERCLRFVGVDKSADEKDAAYMVLSIIVQKCLPQTMKSVQSRLAKRFANIANDYTDSGGFFVREMLIRNPQSGELHANTVYKIVMQAIDKAAIDNKNGSRQLASQLFGLRLGGSPHEHSLLHTLNELLSTKKIKSRTDAILQIETFGVTAHEDALINALFDCLADSISICNKFGVELAEYDVLHAIQKGFQRRESRFYAFKFLRSLCQNGKFSMTSRIEHIVTFLIKELHNVDVDLLQTIAFVVHTFGAVNSTVSSHFYVLFTALQKDFGKDDEMDLYAGVLLSQIITEAAYLIKPEVLTAVQKVISEEAARTQYPIYIQLMCAFMKCGHEIVPAPLQISKWLVSQTRTRGIAMSPFMSELSALTGVASRPRILNLAITNARQIIATEEDSNKILMQEKQEMLERTSEPIVVDLSPPRVPTQENSITSPSPSVATEPEERAVNSPDIVILPSREDRNKKRTTNNGVEAPIVKKVKEEKKATKTQLRDGEASVDEILNFFDPS